MLGPARRCESSWVHDTDSTDSQRLIGPASCSVRRPGQPNACSKARQSMGAEYKSLCSPLGHQPPSIHPLVTIVVQGNLNVPPEIEPRAIANTTRRIIMAVSLQRLWNRVISSDLEHKRDLFCEVIFRLSLVLALAFRQAYSELSQRRMD